MSKSQQIILNLWGEVIESNNTIFSINPRINLIEEIPFLESIFGQIRNINVTNRTELRFNAVTLDTSFSKGIFDFSFVKVNFEGQPSIICTMEEKTENYRNLQIVQQTQNDKAIAYENESVLNYLLQNKR